MTPTRLGPHSISLDAIRAARERIRGVALRTPLVRLNVEPPSASTTSLAPAEIYLKLENLQPIGSFKLRGAANALYSVDRARLANGVITASAGNMAQGVGWVARDLGVPFCVVVPDHAPRTKLEAIERLGGRVVKVPFDRWWQVILSHRLDAVDDAELDGYFVHPVADPAVVAGNGTIGLEILDDLPDVDAVVIPYGGGGLLSGIGSAMRALKPATSVYAVEVETAAPLKRSLESGTPMTVDYTPSFVDGMGGKSVLDEMWPLVRALVDDSLVVSLEATAQAIRTLVERNRVVAEGAGAAAVAAAVAGLAGTGRIVCVVSGGNLDTDKLQTILNGRVP